MVMTRLGRGVAAVAICFVLAMGVTIKTAEPAHAFVPLLAPPVAIGIGKVAAMAGAAVVGGLIGWQTFEQIQEWGWIPWDDPATPEEEGCSDGMEPTPSAGSLDLLCRDPAPPGDPQENPENLAYKYTAGDATIQWSGTDANNRTWSGTTGERPPTWLVTMEVTSTVTYNPGWPWGLAADLWCHNPGLTRDNGPPTGQVHQESTQAGYDTTKTVTVSINCANYTAESRVSGFESWGVKYDILWNHDPANLLGGDPAQADRQIITRLECMMPDGSTSQVVEVSIPYAYDDPVPPIPPASCPDGSRMVGVDIERAPAPGFDLPAPTPIGGWEPPAGSLDAEYPYSDCTRGVIVCELRLQRRVNGQWKRCDALETLCRDWSTDPMRDDLYRCQYGPHTLELAQCLQFRTTFNPDTLGETEPITDPTPTIDPEPAPLPEADTKGILADLFVPSDATQARLDALPDLFAGKPPFNVLPAIEGAAGPLIDLGQSCPNWTVHIGSYQASVLCESSFVARMRDHRFMFLGGMMFVAFGRLMWSVWYAAVPLLKPTRTGGDA